MSTLNLDQAALSSMIGAPVVAGEPMARHSSWRVGGPADYYVRAQSAAVLKQAVLTARANALPCLIVGRGTNILVADAGVRGLVVHAECDGYMLIEREDSALLNAEAGASRDTFSPTNYGRIERIADVRQHQAQDAGLP